MFRKTKSSGEPAPAQPVALWQRVRAFLRSGRDRVRQWTTGGVTGLRQQIGNVGQALSGRFASVGQWATRLRQRAAAAPENYTAPLMRMLRQAPWRSQTQLTAIWAITLLIVAVVGGLYLSVASRAATAGRDVQALEEQKAELQRQNDELRAELAILRSVPNLAARAQLLGFQPALPDQIEYLRVNPITTGAVEVPTATSTERPPTLTEWLAEALTGILPQWHW